MTQQQALRATLVVVGVAGILVAVRGLTIAAPPPAPGPAGPPLLEPLQGPLTPEGRRIRDALAPFDGAIQRAAATWGLDPDLLGAMIWQESRGDPLAARFEPGVADTSYGLMQVLLGTARSLGFAGSVQDMLDPETNIGLGAQYLRSRFDLYPDFRLAVASYNSGSPIPRNGRLLNEGYVNDVRAHLAALKGEGATVA